jgi:hypothetical protein
MHDRLPEMRFWSQEELKLCSRRVGVVIRQICVGAGQKLSRVHRNALDFDHTPDQPSRIKSGGTAAGRTRPALQAKSLGQYFQYFIILKWPGVRF